MQIIEIDPNKKYILALPKMNKQQAQKLTSSLMSFRDDNMHQFLIIYGTDVAVIPADQVVGYTALEDQKSIVEEIHHRYADRDADEGIY